MAVQAKVIGVLQTAPVLQLPYEVRMRSCDTMPKCPITSAHLMLPCYTEKKAESQPVDYTFSNRSKKFVCVCSPSSVHAHGNKFRKNNFKHFKTSVESAK